VRANLNIHKPYDNIRNYLLNLDANTKRETGKVAQLGNIQAAKVLI
jgi:hypothetical protein